MSTDTKQMDAVVLHAAGSPAQALAYRFEPVPQPGPGEVLVEVHAAGVNPFDVTIASGMLGTPLPMIPGGDYAGIVVSDGDHAGQQVWGSMWAQGVEAGITRPGTHARYVALPERSLSRKPERLTMAQAAAVGRSHLAAWQTVINIMELLPGETTPPIHRPHRNGARTPTKRSLIEGHILNSADKQRYRLFPAARVDGELSPRRH